jgi:hypothetical protein
MFFIVKIHWEPYFADNPRNYTWSDPPGTFCFKFALSQVRIPLNISSNVESEYSLSQLDQWLLQGVEVQTPFQKEPTWANLYTKFPWRNLQVWISEPRISINLYRNKIRKCFLACGTRPTMNTGWYAVTLHVSNIKASIHVKYWIVHNCKDALLERRAALSLKLIQRCFSGAWYRVIRWRLKDI